MSHFYGTLQGNRGEATRCGTQASGIRTHAASWRGAVEVQTWEDGGRDMVRVSFIPWRGTGTNRVLYAGPIDPTDPEIEQGVNLPTRAWDADSRHG